MKKIFILLLISGLYACHHRDPYEKSREVYEQTMDIHDEVMPKMGEVLGVKHSLKLKLDSITDLNIKTEMDSAMSELDKTYQEMMNWMAKIQPVPGKMHEGGETLQPNNEETPPPDEMLKIQQESLQQINKIKSQMEKSLKKGKDLLNN